ncbi:MAG: flagellar brake protein [Candidatus Zixiibacteriota bacterium]
MQQTHTQACPRLNIWERIKIVVGSTPAAGGYLARVEDVTDYGFIISLPDFVGGEEVLHDDCEVTVYVARSDAVYQFNSRAQRVTWEGQTVYLIQQPRSAQRLQRRRFARIDFFEKIDIALVPHLEGRAGGLDEPAWQPAAIINLSGGGVLIRLNDEIRDGDRLLLRIAFFPDNELPEVIAGVCRRAFLHRRQYYAGIEFVKDDRLMDNFTEDELAALPESIRHFDQSAQNRLVAYVFRQQVQLRKKGLI